MVIGMRHPAAWTAVILTKVTPGVGLLWFAVRREWRAFLVGAGATAAITAVSFALAPDLWFAWVERLTGGTGTAGNGYMLLLIGRCVLAVGLVVLGALTSRAWLVPVAATVAVPILWPDSLAMLLAAWPLVRWKPAPTRASAAGRRGVTAAA
jgi:hypothetical protein